ncbi:DUF1654 domain-containing protein [Halomonas sp. WWR20]
MAFETMAVEQSSYVQLGKRVQRAINAPRARLTQHIIIERQPDESVEDWESMLEEIDSHGHVTLIRYDDGAIGLRWNLAETSA